MSSPPAPRAPHPLNTARRRGLAANAAAEMSRPVDGSPPLKRLIRILERLTVSARRHLVSHAARLRRFAEPGLPLPPLRAVTGARVGGSATSARMVPEPGSTDLVRAPAIVSAPDGVSPEARVRAYDEVLRRVIASTTDQVPGHRILTSHGVVMATAFMKDGLPWDAVLARVKVKVVEVGGNAVIGLVSSHAALPPQSDLGSREFSMLLMGTAVTVAPIEAPDPAH